MSTSGSFDPASSPPCPQNVFTRAALIALRDAGSLRVDCHYRWDGPVIGTAGNTSPTIIESHAVMPNELSLEAKVETTFDNSAWEGLADIDLGAAGSIIRLVGRWNNVGIDSDPDSPTVQTQIPWHLGSNSFRDNTFQDATLPGWSAAIAAGGTYTDNTIVESAVDLTGKTSGTFVRNNLLGSVLTSAPPASFIAGNVMQLAQVSHAGSGSFSFQNNTLLTGQLTVDAATTAQVTFNSNVMGGTSGGYRVVVQGKTGSNCIISGNRLFNTGLAAQDMLCTGPAEITITANEISAGNLLLDGIGDTRFEGNEFSNLTVNQTAASTGDLLIRVSKYRNAQLTIGPANGALENFIAGADIRGGIITLNGPIAAPARNDFINVDVNSLDVTVAATATAGVRVEGGYYSFGEINQNRTAGTGATGLLDCSMLGQACAVNDNGTVDPGGNPIQIHRTTLNDSVINIGSIDATATIQTIIANLDMTASTLNVTGLPGIQIIERGSMLGSTLTNATFEIKDFTMAARVKTLTADQFDKAASVAFDNFV